jgi:hypothetical protein
MLHVFVRQSDFSAASCQKKRPEWFSYQKCFDNLLNTFDPKQITVIFDGEPSLDTELEFKIIRIKGGSESKSFTKMLDYVMSLNIPDDDIVYFVDDDYMHAPGAAKILDEAFQTNAEYVTLYDDCEKYMPGYYDIYASGFQIQLIHSQSVHWRTTPSTKNTYAMKMSTLKRDLAIHYKFSYFERVGPMTAYHQKFHELWNTGRSLISCIPGYVTHCDIEGITPVVSWSSTGATN